MGFPFFSSFLLISILSLFLVHDVGHSQCMEDQRIYLDEFLRSIKFDRYYSTKLVSWNTSTDCCSWAGVTCDRYGHIISLDLSAEGIEGGLNDSSKLFELRHLRSLNLAYNAFQTPIPSAVGKLVHLMNLDLSYSFSIEKIPLEISQLTRLRILDLTSYPTVALEAPDLRVLFQNLKKVEELRLDGINLSAQGHEWVQALNSSLPNLRVLSLSNCQLSGPIDPSLVSIQSLSVLDLSGNNFSSPFPRFFANFSNLISLKLASCSLLGRTPEYIFRMSNLQTLDLSGNYLLRGTLPEFLQDGSLRSLILSETNFSGQLPKSIGQQVMLSQMDLFDCNFYGPIPVSVANLSQLAYLDLSSNMFTGHISFPLFGCLQKLVWFDLHSNSLTGSIPSSLFNISSLQNILLSNNHFDGLLPEFSNSSSSKLKALELRSNYLQGPIPASLFDLKKLNVLSLSFNNISGTIQLISFQTFPNLSRLDLSYNSLSIETSSNRTSSSHTFFGLTSLSLASCKMTTFPDFNFSNLVILDFSDNQIQGDIPSWIWEVGNGYGRYLNLSHNLLTSLQKPYVISPYLTVLDLHSNLLHGEIPLPPEYNVYVDYSDNHFNSQIPVNIFNGSYSVYFFSVTNNDITGSIPESICNLMSIYVVDLSQNHLTGVIPSCLVEKTDNIAVLNLAENNLVGNVSGNFPRNCLLKTLDLHGNRLEGKLPESLSKCEALEVLNLASNMINDTFPCWMKNLSQLRVLVLRSNRLQGNLQCLEAKQSLKNLQIIDLASNNFSGVLPTKAFLYFKAMMMEEDKLKSELNSLHYKIFTLSEFYYQDKVKVKSKGLPIELVKILNIFTVIDLSSNRFHGNIPEEIGNLTSLYILNLADNALTGQIPSSLGSLKSLESLDLSKNKLHGVIPTQLGGLTFLSFLDLSFNQLEGMIPKGSQIQTFPEASFQGNKGLCGTPFSIECSDSRNDAGLLPPSSSEKNNSDAEIDWDLIAAEIGFAFGFGIVVLPLMCFKKWRMYYYGHIYQVLSRMFKILNKESANGGRRIRRRRSSGRIVRTPRV